MSFYFHIKWQRKIKYIRAFNLNGKSYVKHQHIKEACRSVGVTPPTTVASLNLTKPAFSDLIGRRECDKLNACQIDIGHFSPIHSLCEQQSR